MASPAPAPVITPPVPAPTPEVVKWESAYPEAAWKRIRGEGIYLGCVLIAAVGVAFLMLRVDAQAHPTAKKLLCCGLGGITGSWIYAIRWYVKSVTGKLWAHDFIVWRLTAPFVGIFLAVSTYLIMETGLLGITFNKNNSEANTYAYAIGFLVGLFSDDVMKKLAEVAKTVFGKSTSDDGKPSQGHSTQHNQGAAPAGLPAGPVLVAPPAPPGLVVVAPPPAGQPQPSITGSGGPSPDGDSGKSH